MTSVKRVETTCYVCNTFYEGLELLSWSTFLPKPDLAPLECPNCHAPYKHSVKPQIGLVRDLLPKVESDLQYVASKLVRYSLSDSEIDLWRPVFLNLDEISAAAMKHSSQAGLEHEMKLIKHLQMIAGKENYQPMIDDIIHSAKMLMKEVYAKYRAPHVQ